MIKKTDSTTVYWVKSKGDQCVYWQKPQFQFKMQERTAATSEAENVNSNSGEVQEEIEIGFCKTELSYILGPSNVQVHTVFQGG